MNVDTRLSETNETNNKRAVGRLLQRREFLLRKGYGLFQRRPSHCMCAQANRNLGANFEAYPSQNLVANSEAYPDPLLHHLR